MQDRNHIATSAVFKSPLKSIFWQYRGPVLLSPTALQLGFVTHLYDPKRYVCFACRTSNAASKNAISHDTASLNIAAALDRRLSSISTQALSN